MLATIGCTNDAIITTEITVMNLIESFFKDYPNADLSKLVTIDDRFFTIRLYECSGGIHCNVIYHEDSYLLRLLNEHPTKDIHMCKLVEGLSADDLARLEGAEDIHLTVNGKNVYTPSIDMCRGCAVNASNIQERAFEWIEYNECGSMYRHSHNDHMYYLDAENRLHKATYGECDALNIPYSRRIFYQVVECGYSRGFLFSACVHNGIPVEEHMIESVKVRLSLGEIARVLNKYEEEVLHVNIIATTTVVAASDAATE